MPSLRTEKISDLLLGFLGQEVARLKDPRLELLTLTSVSVTPDLKRAHVYCSKIAMLGFISEPPAEEDEVSEGSSQPAQSNSKSKKQQSDSKDAK